MTEALANFENQGSSMKPIQIEYVPSNYAKGVKIPWQAKMFLKVFLSYLPIPYRFWKSIGIFQHGDLTKNLVGLQSAFKEHVKAYQKDYDRTPESALELGPGDSAGHALSAKTIGMKSFYLIDAGDFASNDARHYKAFKDYLTEKEGAVFTPEPQSYSRQDILKYANATYYTNGVSDMRHIPNDHLDFSFSQAVFEHIRRDEFQLYMHELFRSHKSGSMSRHWVDLHDHLGGALNNFRFSEKFWEGRSVTGAGFYTNRLTMKEMILSAKNAGFEVEIPRVIKWESMPTPIQEMDSSFHDKDETELNICTFLMIMRKP